MVDMDRSFKSLVRRIAIVVIFAAVLWGGAGVLQRALIVGPLGDWLSLHSPYPIRFRAIGIEWAPSFAVGLEGVVVGSGEGRGGAYIERLYYRPGGCWLRARVCGELAAVGVAVDTDFVTSLRDGMRDDGTKQSLPFDRLSVAGLVLRASEDVTLGPYRLSLEIDPRSARIGALSLERIDGRLTLRAVASRDGGRFRIEARRWTWPYGAPVHLERFEAAGVWDDGALTVESLEALGYHGRVTGSGRLDWSRGFSLHARLDGRGLRLGPIVAVFGGHGVDGVFSGRLRFDARSPEATGLLPALVVSGPFGVADGRVELDERLAPLMLDRIDARGRLDRAGLVLSEVAVHAYEGHAEGRGSVLWRPDWLVEGRFDFEGVDAESLLASIVDRPVLGGSVSGAGVFRMASDLASDLGRSPTADVDLRVDDGAFYRVDLEQARQGRTDFDRLRTRIRIAGGVRHLSVTELVSDRLDASGELRIGDDGGVDGAFDVSLRYTASLVSFPVTISGDVSDPDVRPGRSALIGGAIGTGILGPGLGTVVGARIGQFFGSLVGSPDEE